MNGVNGVGQGFVNGSDVLFEIDGACVGHCTSHDTTYNSETKDRAFKPVATAELGDGLWKSTTVTGLSISTNFEGLRHYGETEGGFKKLLAAWKKGQPVVCRAYERGADQPYMVVPMVITSLQETNPASDDATYSGSLQNADKPSVFEPANITGEELEEI